MLVVSLSYFLPSSVVVYVVAHFWNRWRGSVWHAAVEEGFAPISAGLILAGAFAVLDTGDSGLLPWGTALGVAVGRLWRPNLASDYMWGPRKSQLDRRPRRSTGAPGPGLEASVDAWHFPLIGETVSMEPAEELYADRWPIENRHPPNRRARWRVLPTAASPGRNPPSTVCDGLGQCHDRSLRRSATWVMSTTRRRPSGTSFAELAS